MEKRSQQAEQAASEGVKELTEKDAHSIVGGTGDSDTAPDGNTWSSHHSGDGE